MKFDLRTQKLNKKGQVVQKNPYRLYVTNGISKFERPPGSGTFYSADGTLLQEKVSDKIKKQSKELASLKDDLLKEQDQE